MTSNQPRRRFVKSSFSGGSGGNCVEWSFCPDGVYVRDSKNPESPEVLFAPAEWGEFVTAAVAGNVRQWVTVGPTGVTVRKDGAALSFTQAEWAAFLDGVRAGECQPTAA